MTPGEKVERAAKRRDTAIDWLDASKRAVMNSPEVHALLEQAADIEAAAHVSDEDAEHAAELREQALELVSDAVVKQANEVDAATVALNEAVRAMSS